jgi:hypothetical protein
MTDLDAAEALTEPPSRCAAGDVDLELVALAQLGLVRVGKGDIEAGFALIDEATAAALAGERTTLDTVVYACCDMLNAILERRLYAVLATQNNDGTPHVAAVMLLSDNEGIVVETGATTRKARIIAARKHASVRRMQRPRQWAGGAQ